MERKLISQKDLKNTIIERNYKNSKLKSKFIEIKENKAERTTACIRNSGFSAKLKVSAFNKSKCQTESEVLFNPLLLIHAKRYKRFF